MGHPKLTSNERYFIAKMRQKRWSIRRIADAMDRSPSTVSREVRRNRCNDGMYRASKADSRTRTRRSKSRRNSRFTSDNMKLVESLIKADYSPEQAAGRLKKDGLLNICHETIYKHIWLDKKWGGNLYLHLRQSQKRARKRYRSYDNRGILAGKRSIDDRPKHIESRKRIGHWEIDLVHGTGSTHCIVTLVERKTGYVKIGVLPNKTTAELNKRVVHLLSKGEAKSITSDNGTEFHGYKSIESTIQTRFYFAHPYHSWERGSSENVNGLIRQYLPKGKSMEGLTQHRCNHIAKILNNRPRKRLGFRTPGECYGNR